MDTRTGVVRIADYETPSADGIGDAPLKRYVMRLGMDYFLRMATACSEVMRRPEVDRLVAANFANVRQFVVGLHSGASEMLTPHGAAVEAQAGSATPPR